MKYDIMTCTDDEICLPKNKVLKMADKTGKYHFLTIFQPIFTKLFMAMLKKKSFKFTKNRFSGGKMHGNHKFP